MKDEWWMIKIYYNMKDEKWEMWDEWWTIKIYYKIQDTRYKIQDTRYKIQDSRFKICLMKIFMIDDQDLWSIIYCEIYCMINDEMMRWQDDKMMEDYC
jgi:hypothetical protein